MSKVIDLDEIERLQREEENSQYKAVKSKTTVKKDALEITDFGRSLTELSKEQLGKLPIDENLKNNILNAKNLQKIALKRQIQFIGKLLRKTDNLEEIYQAYDVLVNKDKSTNLMLQRLENIRSNLLDPSKSNATLDKLIEEYANIDVQKLRQLIRNHHKEIEKNKLNKSFKEIFKLLKTLV
ncbi:ribosome-associated protein [Francisella noatunensis]|uniref:Dual-action ribosomal maturation protein DarP n=1 Tax=Francisella noatunensis TaxID=657445 RepID=A0A9Q2QDU0_9GAMM|nr:ribosome biogenesis factor YjgA [Francisella noatunensis]MBK2028337.1 ribosome-associated protein [Francisella noatunensis]MBK2034448.1 ribosome-associated protein [Francisella noatunensis]MBK2049044.1 ribosome-associated protein [Francisella noatunensis]MBK2049779.1 ribosome-associated protein [Francisella noatunensis]MBK2051971.1 ribosome-associated protein [Francisella noatunensis]